MKGRSYDGTDEPLTRTLRGTMTKAIVIGAGIGGLAAGIALHGAGLDVEIFERTPELRAVGAGLSLWANALTALEHLGLKEAVQRHSVATGASGSIRTWSGAALMVDDSSTLREHFGETVVGIHRAALQRLLLSAFGEGRVRLGQPLTHLEERGGQVTAYFADGTSARGDLLVGADGLHSVVRRQLHGEHTPRYAGYSAWRSVVPARLLPSQVGEYWGDGKRFGLLPLAEGHVYWFTVRTQPEGVKIVKQELLHLFRGWTPPTELLIAAALEEAILQNDIYDRPVLKDWGRGRVTLLGDAAHPMTPNLGQGACQALEDAVVLGRCLERGMDAVAALRRYECLRRARTDRIVRQSRLLGTVAQGSNPLLAGFRNTLFKHVLSHTQERQLRTLLSFEGDDLG